MHAAPHLEAPSCFLLYSSPSLHLPSFANTLSELYCNHVGLLRPPVLQALCLISPRRDSGLP